MNIVFSEQITQEKWDEFVGRVCPWSFFQSWRWGDVQKAGGYKIWRVGIYTGEKLVGVMQIARVSARRGAFIQVRQGPVLHKFTEEFFSPVILYLKALGRRERAWFVRINPMVAATEENVQLFASLGGKPAAIHAMDAEHCLVLDLHPAPEQLLQNMRKTTRYEINRSQKLGVNIKMGGTDSDFVNFLMLYEKTAARQGFVPHRELKDEWQQFSKSGSARLFLATHEGMPLAGAMIIYSYNQAIYHHGASLPGKVPASYAVQWAAIREAKKRGLDYYNFWGIAPDDRPNHPWRGLTLFKNGFGGQPQTFVHAFDFPISRWYWLPRSVETVRRHLRNY